MTIVPLTGGPKPFDAMREALRHGAFVPLPADRDLTANGVEVDFCGHRARVAKGPAALAVATGAALFTAAVWYEDARPARASAARSCGSSSATRSSLGLTSTLTRRSAISPSAVSTSSVPESPSTPAPGTCCSASSSTTSTRPDSARDEDRHRLPLLVRRPGRVQFHVRDLAEYFIAQGHFVSVLAPANDETADLPPYVVTCGRAVPVRYNGSVARLTFGPVTGARVAKWLENGGFDVLHLHEPVTPSASMLALWASEGPDRGDLPHLEPAVPGHAGGLPARPCQPGEDRWSDRRLRGRPSHRDHSYGR